MKDITKRLKGLRFDKRMNQRNVALKADMPLNRYWEIENGYRTPDEQELARIAKALKCQPADILPSAHEVQANG